MIFVTFLHMQNYGLKVSFQISTFLVLIICCICTSLAQSSVDVNRKFTPEQLINDVKFYLKTGEETRVNPFVYISRKQWLAQAGDIKSRIGKLGQ